MTVFEAEDQSPVCCHSNRPEAFQFSRQSVRAKSWQLHLLGIRGPIQRRQDTANPRNFMWREAAWVIVHVQSAKTPVPNTTNHSPSVCSSRLRDNAEHHSFSAANRDASVFQCNGRGLVLGSGIRSASRAGNARRNSLSRRPLRRIGKEPLASRSSLMAFGTASRILSSPEPSRRTCSYRSQIAMFSSLTCLTLSSYGARASFTTRQCCITLQNQF